MTASIPDGLSPVWDQGANLTHYYRGSWNHGARTQSIDFRTLCGIPLEAPPLGPLEGVPVCPECADNLPK